jgi:hypothetical protein
MCSHDGTSYKDAFQFLGKSHTLCCRILNRINIRTLNEKTLFATWIGTKPFVAHTKVFGSVCYVHVPKDLHGKLDSKNKFGCFMG